MTVAEMIDELVRIGLYRQCLRVNQIVNIGWAGDRAGHEKTEIWELHGRLDRSRGVQTSTLNEFFFNERANTLDQLLDRMRLLLGAKKPGDDAKAAGGDTKVKA